MGNGESRPGKNVGTVFTVPPERYISADTWQLLDHCKVLLKGENAEQWKEVAQLVESLSQFEFLALRRRLKRNFQTFALAAQGKNSPGKPAESPSDTRLDKEELRFMGDMVDLLQACHFRLLSQEDWDSAQAEEFTFTMPIEVNWQFMDKALMSRFWATRPGEERLGKAAMVDRIFVFHRGVTLMKAQGMFLMDKVDLLVSYLIMQPLTDLYERFVPDNIKAYAPRLTVDVNEHMQGSEMTGHTGQDSDAPISSSQASPLSHMHAQEVKRVTLKDLMPNSSAVFDKLLSKLTIQEPGFKNVVILYRRRISDKPEPKNEKTPIRECDPRLARRNIHIKRFDNIPMADTEMVFPDKRVYVKPLTLITLFVTIVMGIVACITSALASDFSLGTFLTVLSVFGGRAYQVYYSATVARQQVMDSIMEALYEQTMDAQEGVLYYLLDQMADQHTKETLLAYVVLLISGKSMSRDRLDQACEQHLAKAFGQEVDFAIERSLPELLSDGLVTQHEGLLTAQPLERAHALLKQKWARAFQGSQQQQQAGAAPTQAASAAGDPDSGDAHDERIKRLSQHATKSFSGMPGTPPGPRPRSKRPQQDLDAKPHRGVGGIVRSVMPFMSSKHGSKKRE